MQTILGYGGAIGAPLATALADFTDHVRYVSRTPTALPRAAGVTYEYFPADLLNSAAAGAAVAGSEVVYLIVGLPYRTAVWRRDWPRLMDNVVRACEAAGTRLVFLDNIYALDPAGYDGLRETTPLSPPSEKGRLRRDVLTRLREARVPWLIARAADFYGPGIDNSLLLELVVKRLAAGQAAQWLGNRDRVHTFTYTPDAGRALAQLGNAADAFGQTWNLPADPERVTVRELTERAANLLEVNNRLRVIPRPLYWLLARFSTDLRELYDVRHQLDGDYWMDSRKFTSRFGLKATPYANGLRAVVRSLVEQKG